MTSEEQFMRRCLELAENGKGRVSPNPMVGCVIVKDGKIIGEGWHQSYGGPHAEANAINNAVDRSAVKGSTVYVSLEPCAHFGKTPPCSDLLIDSGISEAVIACVDSFSEVSGKGIQKLKNAGIKVRLGVLEAEARSLNRRFFTFHEKQRPYIILKWAQTADGFIDKIREEGDPLGVQNRISGKLSKKLVHKWRTEEPAILVGKATALNDNPQLNVRYWDGKQPLRLAIDKNLELPNSLHLFDKSIKTLVFTEKEKIGDEMLEFVQADFKNLPTEICKELYNRGLQSLIIEGGKKTLEAFIEAGLWDEARVFVSSEFWHNGLPAPKLPSCKKVSSEKTGRDHLFIFNKHI